ncbi:MAG: flagellar basal body L-ring protein FlgH [Candidatus Lindowbacteria bacterium]|nr:flagellar basal body L-ring protein FlgH [Candidatus Lindowbacteria bacterium]
MRLFLRGALSVTMIVLLAQASFAVSLWTDEGSLYTARRSYQKGDIITIKITESTTANSNWKHERKKANTVEATATPSGGGPLTNLANIFGRVFPSGVDVDYETEYKTDNKADRSTSVTANVAAEVLNVLPNGTLQLLARKVIRVNAEEQTIELTGNVRPQDVSPANVVLSSNLANARILVNGELRYTNDAKPSLIEKFFSFVFGSLF